jgi:hypothetical protein
MTHLAWDEKTGLLPVSAFAGQARCYHIEKIQRYTAGYDKDRFLADERSEAGPFA